MARKNTLDYKKMKTILPRISSSQYDLFMRALEREGDALTEEISGATDDLNVDLCRAARLSEIFGPFFTSKPVALTIEEWRVWLKALMANFLHGPTWSVIKDKFYILTGVEPTIEPIKGLVYGWVLSDPDPMYALRTPWYMVDDPTVAPELQPTIKLFSESVKYQGVRVTVSNPYGRPLLKDFMRWLIRNIKPAHVVVELAWPTAPIGFIAANGEVFQWDGTDVVGSVATVDFHATAMVSDELGFVVGGSATGVAYKWDGALVQDGSLPTGAALWGMWVNELRAVVAVGESGRVVMWDPTTKQWTDQDVGLPTFPTLYAVSGFGSENYWIGGAGSTDGVTTYSQLWHVVNGNAVNIAVPAAAPVEGIAALFPDDAWFCGGSYILHWDGAGITGTQPLGTGVALNSITALSAADIWVVGYDTANGNRKMLHWDGTAWSDLSDGGTGQLYSVSAVSASEVYACGAAGLLLKWNGSVWSEEDAHTTKDLNEVGFYRFSPVEWI